MNNKLPAEWQAIADDIRSWYAKDATTIYQNAIEATVQRCYALANKNNSLLRPAVIVDVSQISSSPLRPNKPMSAGAYERAIRAALTDKPTQPLKLGENEHTGQSIKRS